MSDDTATGAGQTGATQAINGEMHLAIRSAAARLINISRLRGLPIMEVPEKFCEVLNENGFVITDAARVPSAAVLAAMRATRDFSFNFRSTYPVFDPEIDDHLAELDAYLAGVTDGE